MKEFQTQELFYSILLYPHKLRNSLSAKNEKNFRLRLT